MATNLDIIKRALRKLRVLAAGRNPDGDSASDTMDALRGLYMEDLALGAFGSFADVLATANYTAREFDRIRASVGVTVTLPTTITEQTYVGQDYAWPALTSWGGWDYGAWTADTPRPPFNNAVVQVINSAGVATTSTYVAERGAWVAFDDLDQQATFPFGVGWENGYAARLAERIAPDFGKDVDRQTTVQAAMGRYVISQHLDSRSQPVAVDYF